MALQRWLWDAADELLQAWGPPGSEKTYRDPSGRTWTERGTAPDLERFQQAYDNLLWQIVTSPRDKLLTFAARFYEEPYINLPPPLQVTVWRLLGLEPGACINDLRAAVAGIALYCSPTEEEGASSGVKERLKQLAGTTDAEAAPTAD
jgi:hypothetical protein